MRGESCIELEVVCSKGAANSSPSQSVQGHRSSVWKLSFHIVVLHPQGRVAACVLRCTCASSKQQDCYNYVGIKQEHHDVAKLEVLKQVLLPSYRFSTSQAGTHAGSADMLQVGLLQPRQDAISRMVPREIAGAMSRLISHQILSTSRD